VVRLADLPDGIQSLTPGTSVTFTGSPQPKPGKRYPLAYAIRTAPTAEEMPST
jgi:hypothetical protein